jgi:hypothetical protein
MSVHPTNQSTGRTDATSSRAADERPPRRQGPILALARVGWVVVALATVGLDLYAIPPLYRLAANGCPDPGPCAVGVQFLTASQLAQLHAQGISSDTVAMLTIVQQTAATLIFVAVAAIIFWRRSDGRMALFAAYALVTFGGAVVGGALQVLPATNFVWFLLMTTLVAAGQIMWVTFFALFPDGNFVPGWTRWAALAWTLPWLATYVPGLSAATEPARSGPLLVVLVIFALMIGQVYRYRRVSDARQRRQTKWVVYGFALGIGCFAAMLTVVNFALGDLSSTDPLVSFAFSAAAYVLISLIPITIGVAILRYRLYDIDLIIRRTLIYGSLTAILIGIYLVGVVGTQTLIGRAAGQAVQQQPLVIVATTLVIAALFQPLQPLVAARHRPALLPQQVRRRADADHFRHCTAE